MLGFNQIVRFNFFNNAFNYFNNVVHIINVISMNLQVAAFGRMRVESEITMKTNRLSCFLFFAFIYGYSYDSKF